VDPARLTRRLRERGGARIRILRLLPAAGGRLLAGAVTLQVLAGVVPVGFIVATSGVVGRVPAAVEGGVESPAWDSLRNALLAASVIFLLLHLSRASSRTASRCVDAELFALQAAAYG
jgi:ATP-binding cassette subfamily B protein